MNQTHDPAPASPELQPATPDQVRAYIEEQQKLQASQQTLPKVEMPKEQAFEVDTRMQEALPGLVRRETVMHPEPQLPLTAGLDDRLADKLTASWQMRDPADPSVIIEASPEERDEFITSMMFDRPSKWKVFLVDGRLEVRITQPPQWVTDMVERVAEKQSGRAMNDTPTSTTARTGGQMWIHHYTRALVYTRVTQVIGDDKEILAVPAHDLDVDDTLDVAEAKLQKLLKVNDKVRPELFSLLRRAVFIQDVRWNICARKAASGNFS